MGFLADFGRSNAYQIGQQTIKDWSDTNRAATLAVPQAQVEAANAEGARIAKSIEMVRQMEADKIARAKAEREQKVWYRENEAPIHADLGIAALGVYGRMPSVSEHAKSLLPMYTEEVNGVRVFRGTKSLENWKKAVGDSKDFFALEQRDLLTKQAEIGKTMAAAMDEIRAAERAVQGLQPRVEPGYVEEGMGGSTVTVPPDPALVTKAQAAVAAARQKYEAEKDKMSRLNAALEQNAMAAGEKMQTLSQGAVAIMPGSGRVIENPMEFAPGSGGKNDADVIEEHLGNDMMQKYRVVYGPDKTTVIQKVKVGEPYSRFNKEVNNREEMRDKRYDRLSLRMLQESFGNSAPITKWKTIKATAIAVEGSYRDGLKTGDWKGNDQILAMKFNKLLDETSVVMPSEFMRIAASQGLTQQTMGDIQRAASGGVGLTDSTRASIVRASKELIKAARQLATEQVDIYRKRAESQDLDPDKVIAGYEDLMPKPVFDPRGGK